MSYTKVVGWGPFRLRGEAARRQVIEDAVEEARREAATPPPAEPDADQEDEQHSALTDEQKAALEKEATFDRFAAMPRSMRVATKAGATELARKLLIASEGIADVDTNLIVHDVTGRQIDRDHIRISRAVEKFAAFARDKKLDPSPIIVVDEHAGTILISGIEMDFGPKRED